MRVCSVVTTVFHRFPHTHAHARIGVQHDRVHKSVMCCWGLCHCSLWCCGRRRCLEYRVVSVCTVHARAHVYTHTHTPGTLAHARLRVHTNFYVRMHSRACTQTHTHTYTRVRAHTHTHTCALIGAPAGEAHPRAFHRGGGVLLGQTPAAQPVRTREQNLDHSNTSNKREVLIERHTQPFSPK